MKQKQIINNEIGDRIKITDKYKMRIVDMEQSGQGLKALKSSSTLGPSFYGKPSHNAYAALDRRISSLLDYIRFLAIRDDFVV